MNEKYQEKTFLQKKNIKITEYLKKELNNIMDKFL